MPEKQLRQSIQRTRVRPEHRGVFLGTAAAAMIAVLGMAGCGQELRGPVPTGIRPDEPESVWVVDVEIPVYDESGSPFEVMLGSRPDRPVKADGNEGKAVNAND